MRLHPIAKESLIWVCWVLFSILHSLSILPTWSTVAGILLPILPDNGFLFAVGVLSTGALITFWGAIGPIGVFLIGKAGLIKDSAYLGYFWAGILVLSHYLRVGGYIPYQI